MSAESTGQSAPIHHWRLTFRHWRWQRPFWAGLLTLLAGVPIVYFPYANLTLGQLTIRMATTAGSGSLIIGILLFVLGLTMWFQTAVRFFAGIATILLGLVSLVISNFGGFLVGFLLALIGGALAVSWAPGVPVSDEPGDPAELPDGAPGSGAGSAGGGPGGPEPAPDAEPFLPAQAGEDRAGESGPGDLDAPPEPVHAGTRSDDESTEENGRHRAG